MQDGYVNHTRGMQDLQFKFESSTRDAHLM